MAAEEPGKEPDARFEDLFGEDDDDDHQDAGMAQAGGADKPTKKEKKDKKDKKDKKEKTDKPDKKDKKEKGEKKEKGDKKEKKNKENKASAQPAAETVQPAAEALQPAAEAVQPAPAKEGNLKKEKKDKSGKKDKKEKKEKKGDQAAPSSVVQAAPAAEPENKVKKDKKEKKDKKDKKDKKRKGVEEDVVPEQQQDVADDAEVPPTEPLTDVVQDVLNDAVFDDLLQDIAGPEPITAGPDEGAFDEFDDDQDHGDAVNEFMVGLQAEPAPSSQPMDLVPTIIPPFERQVRKKSKVESLQLAPIHSQDEEPGEQNLVGKLGEVMDSLKLKRALQITERDASSFIENFVEEMVQAAENDLRAFEANPLQAAPNKMNMLGKAVSVMQKFVFGELFVTYGGCRALALWLRKLPNGELPNAHLRTTLLNCMLRLPISKEALQNCKEPRLGEIVAALQKNPIETVANRKVAAMLVQKWIKQVLVVAPDVFDAGDNEAPKAMLPRKPAETMESFLAAEEESFKRIHPTIPIREGKDYQIHPPANAVALKRDKYQQDSNRYKLNEVLKDFNRPNKKTWRPYEVSIAGRQLNQL